MAFESLQLMIHIIFHKTFKAMLYCTVAIITRGLYFFNSLFEYNFFVFKDVFWEILSLCMAERIEGSDLK